MTTWYFKNIEAQKEYNSIAEAARDVGANRRTLNDCLLGKQKTSASFRWEYI